MKETAGRDHTLNPAIHGPRHGVHFNDQLDLAGRHEIDIRETLQMHPVPELRGLPELHSPHTTNGTWDRIAEIRTDSLTDFDRVLREARTIDGVLNSEPSILPSSA